MLAQSRSRATVVDLLTSACKATSETGDYLSCHIHRLTIPATNNELAHEENRLHQMPVYISRTPPLLVQWSGPDAIPGSTTAGYDMYATTGAPMNRVS